LADLPFVVDRPGAIDVVTAVARAAARSWGLPEPTLIRVGMNALFAAGDEVVLRVGRPTAEADAAIRLAAVLRDCGVRVPRILRPSAHVEGPLAVLAVALEHSVGPVDWAEVGALITRVHAIDPHVVPLGYPKPSCWSFPWWQFDGLLVEAGDLLDPRARRGIEAAIGRHASVVGGTGEPTVLCHGDVHPGNVIQGSGGPVLLDWDLLCVGPPGWDHGPLMTWTERWGGEPGTYDAFATGYGLSLRGDPSAEAVAELRLVAATLMRLLASRFDPSAVDEAERRLRWWRGDRTAPMWQAA
jgi:hypothetical protein